MKYFEDRPPLAAKRTVQLIMKEANARQLFLSVCRQGSTSRAALAKEAQLSPTTVSALIDEMIGRHLLLETGEVVVSKSGRRPLMLEADGSGRNLPVMVFSSDGIAYSLYDLCFHQLDSFFFPTDYSVSLQELVRQVLASAQPWDTTPVPALCVVLSSFFAQHGEKITTPDYSVEWRMEDFSRLAFGLRMPVLLAEESVCSTYAVLRNLERGDGKKRVDLLYLDLGDEIGCGLVSKGELVTREDGVLMDPGHLCIDPKGKPCSCGGKGCAVQYIGRKALLERAYEKARSHPESLLAQDFPTEGDSLDYSLFCRAFSQYDPLARELMEEFAGWLSLVIRNCLCLFPARTVVLGGCEELGEGFLYLLRKQMTRESQFRVKNLELMLSSLGKEGGSLGAARLLAEAYMPMID